MNTIIFFLILLELIYVGWSDIKNKKISNYWIFVNVGLSLVFYSFLPDPYLLSWGILLFPACFIVMGFLLFLLKIMGAGDSKFLASLFLVIPTEFHILFFEKLIQATLFTGLILLTVKIFNQRNMIKAYLINRHWSGMRDLMKSNFSYAPVVVISWLLVGFDIWK